jgi:hypothetical protein
MEDARFKKNTLRDSLSRLGWELTKHDERQRNAISGIGLSMDVFTSRALARMAAINDSTIGDTLGRHGGHFGNDSRIWWMLDRPQKVLLHKI